MQRWAPPGIRHDANAGTGNFCVCVILVCGIRGIPDEWLSSPEETLHLVYHLVYTVNYRGRHPTQTRLSALEPWITFVYSEAYYIVYEVRSTLHVSSVLLLLQVCTFIDRHFILLFIRELNQSDRVSWRLLCYIFPFSFFQSHVHIGMGSRGESGRDRNYVLGQLYSGKIN